MADQDRSAGDEAQDDVSPDLPTRLVRLQPPPLTLPPPASLARAGRRRRTRRRAVIAGSAAVAVLAVSGVALAVTGSPRQFDTIVADAPAEQPLTLDGAQPLACGVAPLATLDDAPGAERADTPAAAALRKILAEGIAGMSFPPRDGWVLLTASPTHQTFGHRTGAVGVDDTVGVEIRDGLWDFAGSGGCGPSSFDGRRATRVSTYRVQGEGLVLNWSGGTCGDELGGGREDVRVRETADAVQVLIVPGLDPNRGACAGVGTSEQTPVTLSAPLGDRQVQDVAYYPAPAVPSEVEQAAEYARQAADQERADTFCTRAARTLGVRTDIAYPLTAGIVRRALQGLPDGWATLAADTPVAQCYLRGADDPVLSVVVADGLEPYVYDRTHPVGGLFAILGTP